jgi:FtsZ-binding cell division protein ZapB
MRHDAADLIESQAAEIADLKADNARINNAKMDALLKAEAAEAEVTRLREDASFYEIVQGNLRALLAKQVTKCGACRGTGKIYVGDSADLNEDRYEVHACPDCSIARAAINVPRKALEGGE